MKIDREMLRRILTLDDSQLKFIISRIAAQTGVDISGFDMSPAALAKLRLAVESADDAELEKLHNAKTADVQEVMEYLTAVLRGESSASVVVVEGVGDGCSEARTITKPPDEKERLKAAELLGKRFGMFTDKVNVSGNVPVVICGENDLPE